MYYTEVLVADASFHGDEALTYSHASRLAKGTVVVVPLRRKHVLGIAVREALKPSFVTKPILEVPSLPPLPAPTLALLFWIKQYYPAPLGAITQQFLPKRLPHKIPSPSKPPLYAMAPLPKLTPDQSQALDNIARSGTYLLHGHTGTGKTRVYIELAKRSLDAGQSVVILTPEIGLTSQLANAFQEAFQAQVVTVHSQLSEATRRQLWISLLQQEAPVVVIGARSALFCPIRHIGLIVIDESHETAYKQDQAPHYHASRVAGKLADLHNAPLVLGSATPLINDYYMATAKGRPIIPMRQTAATSPSSDTHISIIDLRDRSQFTKKAYISDYLLKAVEERLQIGEQTLLFLNRRGTARIVFCEACGWQSTCPHCDLPLIYHGDIHIMRCHSCNYKTFVPSSCTNCHNASIIFRSIGTKAIVDEVGRLFPEARLMRFDTDNKKQERIEQHFDFIKNGGVDILIGTQMIAKGLDLPHLSLVGVITADTSLYFPDFSAQERTYQLLSQVIGRVGRGHRRGEVVIQTYEPESPLLKAVTGKDWDTFYNEELRARKTFLFPPFCYLLKLTCRRATTAAAEQSAKSFAQTLKASGLQIIVEGPTPSFHEKVLNKYGWQLVIKAKRRGELLKVLGILPSGWTYDIDPMNLL